MKVDAGNADTRLAVYGTLAPGRENHGQLAGLAGRWRKGTVRGWLNPAGWAERVGYPGLVLDPRGPAVEVDLFESADLPEHWARLDAFEGSDYRRALARVSTPGGDVDAWIYVIAAGIDTRPICESR
jgi:gamma-glutamylcyclotransferase (GGCT)/AIG2-like uncharacterized protein YtfP